MDLREMLLIWAVVMMGLLLAIAVIGLYGQSLPIPGTLTLAFVWVVGVASGWLVGAASALMCRSAKEWKGNG